MFQRKCPFKGRLVCTSKSSQQRLKSPSHFPCLENNNLYEKEKQRIRFVVQMSPCLFQDFVSPKRINETQHKGQVPSFILFPGFMKRARGAWIHAQGAIRIRRRERQEKQQSTLLEGGSSCEKTSRLPNPGAVYSNLEAEAYPRIFQR